MGELVREFVGEFVGTLVTEALPLPEPEGLREEDPLSVQVPDGVPVPVLLKVAAAEREAEGVEGGAPPRVAEGVWVPGDVGGRVDEGVAVCVGALEPDNVGEGVPVGRGERVPEVVLVPVFEEDGVPVGKAVLEGVTEAEPVLEVVTEGVGKAVWEPLGVAVAVGLMLGSNGTRRTALNWVPTAARVRNVQASAPTS